MTGTACLCNWKQMLAKTKPYLTKGLFLPAVFVQAQRHDQFYVMQTRNQTNWNKNWYFPSTIWLN